MRQPCSGGVFSHLKARGSCLCINVEFLPPPQHSTVLTVMKWKHICLNSCNLSLEENVRHQPCPLCGLARTFLWFFFFFKFISLSHLYPECGAQIQAPRSRVTDSFDWTHQGPPGHRFWIHCEVSELRWAPSEFRGIKGATCFWGPLWASDSHMGDSSVNPYNTPRRDTLGFGFWLFPLLPMLCCLPLFQRIS